MEAAEDTLDGLRLLLIGAEVVEWMSCMLHVVVKG